MEALVSVVWPPIVRLDTEVVAKVEVPVTTKVLVVVLLVVVRLVINEVRAETMEEKKLDDVALVA